MARRTEAAPTRRRAKPQAEETTRKARAAKSEEPTRRRGRTEEAGDSEEVTTKARRKKTASAVADAFNPYAELDKELDKIEKSFGLSSTGVDPWEERMSTGLLVLDLILSGGIVGGNWYTNFGPEQSTKTTGAIAILAMALIENVPVINFYDYENSFQPDYFEAVVATLYRALGLTPLACNEIFGVQDAKGNWVQRPRIRRYQEAVAEKFFNSIAKTLKVLPEKRRIGDSWYYLYEDTKEHRKLCEGRYDKNYLSKTGMLKVEAQDGRLQGIALVDSYPAMLPEAMDEKEENGNGMAAQARMFSDQIKRVKGRLRGRRFTVLGVNQVRQKPAAMFSNPEYEPCGDALKFYSDVRLRYNSRSLSGVPYAAGKGQIEEEKSISGKGNDSYRYIHVRAHKNKLSTPGLEGWLRVWVSDRKGKAHGYCPVWDTFMYLIETGQIECASKSSRAKLFLRLKRFNEEKQRFSDVAHDGVAFNWDTFKKLVLGTNEQIKEACTELGLKPLRLRKHCFNQMKQRLEDGTLVGVHLMFTHKYAEGLPEKGEEDEHEEGDEE